MNGRGIGSKKDNRMINLTQEQSNMLFDNGFSSPEELALYSKYETQRLGCNLENRFYVMDEGSGYVHNEYEMLDLLMEVAHGPTGREWKLVRQELKTGFEPSMNGDIECPYYVDILTIRLPGGQDEKYYFDVTAWFLSMDRFEPDGEFYEDCSKTDGSGFQEIEE